MPSTIGWIDLDDSHHESMKRVLALFRESETRDELGLGAVRDSIADKLFPGTSTLQTRLRYMLFVPWMYQHLEAQRAPADEVARKARRAELALIEPLLANAPDGVIGRIARASLKTLPSSIYWASLTSWGLLRFAGSQRDYHRAFDRIAERRTLGRRRQDVDVLDESALTWHGGLPTAPDDFPESASFLLTRDEAEYLRDRLREEHSESLLASLAAEDWDVPAEQPIWAHPKLGSFRMEHQELVLHAQIFAEAMHGAAILYNLELARTRADDELVQQRSEQLAQWVGAMQRLRAQLLHLSLDRLWTIAQVEGRTISFPTRMFVTQWFDVARVATLAAADGEPARRLIRGRERSLKRAQSRFDNRIALAQWSGSSGLMMLNYRWSTASGLLRDLRAGLTGKEG